MNELIAVSLLCASAVSGPTLPEAGGVTLDAQPRERAVHVRMLDGSGVEYANGLVRYEIRLKDAGEPESAAVVAVDTAEGLAIQAHAAGIEIRHEIRPLPDRTGFLENIRVRNTTEQSVVVDDYRFGLRRDTASRGTLRAVAVPFRRQADGRLRDWSLAEIEAGKGANSDWRNDPAVIAPQPVDSARGRLRSEGWILTDGKRGLLIAKYNQEDIEYSHLDWETGVHAALTFGGSSFALHREPESMQTLAPSQWVHLGETFYIPFEGDWPAGYAQFRNWLNSLGHGLSADYDPPINWNELFDVGWYHSDRAALTQHWTRAALLGEAAKASEIGATALYLDPGWEVCEGTSLWDTERLGPVDAFARQVREQFGLGLAFRTIGRVYRDEFPRHWYIQHGPEAKPYEQPFLTKAAEPEPVPMTDADGRRNLARHPRAKASASSTLAGYAIHKPEHLNDGWYNNPASWVSAGEPSWAQIDLGAAYEIARVCLGSEHTAHHGDRAAAHIRILLATEYADESSDSHWHAVAESKNTPIRDTTCFDFAPCQGRYVRIDIPASIGGEVRLDEIEVYEAQSQPWDDEPARRPVAIPPAAGTRINFWEVCTLNPAWQEEKLQRLLKIAPHGMCFAMFDEFDWRGPCYSREHGHAVPSTPEGHTRAVYELIRKVKQHTPGLLVEAHDPVWPWGVRYLPIYFGQSMDPARRPGVYEENWGFEFMWNPIEDLISGRALCLYYYALACDIPLYDHITMENDNDACLAFWWYASTVRHLGIGGKKGLNSTEDNLARWQAWKNAMRQYSRLREWFVRGQLAGLDEMTHLHVLPGRPGGILVAFNLTTSPVQRDVSIDLHPLNMAEITPRVTGAAARVQSGRLELSLQIPARSPLVVEIGPADR
ncbi:MAG: discoidin domain-containing protein [Phycisphaerae bacterium]|nr:discoidin domain-containing protein [Phycisphaerae bacterium]